MTHMDWRRVAEHWQRRMAERCLEEGHTWEPLEGFGDVCRWCDAVAAVDDRAVSDEERFAA